MKLSLRIAIGLLVAAALGVALIPLFVLLDLGGGGSGWGVCDEGVEICRTSYFAGFELIAWLMGAMFVIVGLIALLAKVLRWNEAREKESDDPAIFIG